VFTFTISSIKQFGFEAALKSVFKLCLKVLISLADLQLYNSELQLEGALTLNAFTDSVSIGQTWLAVDPLTNRQPVELLTLHLRCIN